MERSMAANVTALAGKEELHRARQLADQVGAEIGQVILGKQAEIQLAFTCLLADGHLLIEDVPGVGKTLLARSLAGVLGLSFRRIQFTSDMLPADIVGMSILEQATATFRFHPGPIFSHVVLADEINRATPKAQSALLEAMEEHQVTLDGHTHALPTPFFVIATQNPLHQAGTFPLPESQLDRFLMRIGLGYPGEALERKLLRGDDRREMLGDLRPVIDVAGLASLRAAARELFLSDALLDYVQALVRFTRQSAQFDLGLSPRGAQDLVGAARCWALIHGHPGVHPEDVKAVFPAVAGHRLRPRQGGTAALRDPARLVLESVPVP
ncbi:MAG: AAA family ATPase [Gammaproteobacteria bacterium]|nr:AAA family ATPase [Gammaproteobacteria bacterium]